MIDNIDIFYLFFHLFPGVYELNEVYNIFIAFDTSQSINKNDFEKIKAFIKGYLHSHNLTSPFNKFQLISFAENVMSTDPIDNEGVLYLLLKKLPRMLGELNFKKLLEHVKMNLADARNVLLVVTSNNVKPEESRELNEASKQLRRYRVPILVLGIGSNFNKDSYTVVTGSDRNIFHFPDISTLPDELGEFEKLMGKELGKSFIQLKTFLHKFDKKMIKFLKILVICYAIEDSYCIHIHGVCMVKSACMR